MPDWDTASDADSATTEADVAHPGPDIFLDLEIEDWTGEGVGSNPGSPWATPTGITTTLKKRSTLADLGSSDDFVLYVTGDPGNDTVFLRHDSFPAKQYDQISFEYWEYGSGQTGVLMNFYDSNGNRMGKVGTNNPEVEVWYGDGSGTLLSETVVSSPSPSYEAWRRCTVTFDWANDQFDFTWEDLDGSTPPHSSTGYTLRGSGTSLGEVGYTSDEGGGSAMDCYIDNVAGILQDGHHVDAAKTL
jgi:hypothetical protein